MSESKKKILSDVIFSNEKFKSYIDSLDLEVVNEKKDIESESLLLCDLNNKVLDKKPLRITDEVKSGKRYIINENHIEIPMIQSAFKRMLGINSSLNPEEAMGGELLQNFTSKIEDIGSIGYYSDLIINSCKEEPLNHASIRFCLSSLSNYLLYLFESEVINIPAVLDYGWDSSSFYLQITLDCENYNIENVYESLNDENKKSPYVCSLNLVYAFVDSLEIYQLENRKKLVVSCVWINETQKITSSLFSSLFINNIESFSYKEVIQHYPNLETKVNLIKKGLNSPLKLSGKKPTIKKVGLFDKTKKIFLIKRTTEFIFNKIANSDVSEGTIITVPELIDYLHDFSEVEKVVGLSESDKDLVIKVINNKFYEDELDENIQVIKGLIDGNEYIENIIDSLKGIDDEEFQRILGTKEPLEEGQTVKGNSSSIDDENILVKEEKGATVAENTVIKGVTENIKEEVWSVKKLALTKELKEKKMLLKSLDKKSTDIDVDIVSIVGEFLNLKKEDSVKIVKKLGENVAEEFCENDDKSSIEFIKNRFELQKVENDLHVKSEQNLKMKSIITRMKDEMLSLRNKNIDESDSKATSTSSDGEIQRLLDEKEDLQKKIDSLEKKNLTLIDKNESKLEGVVSIEVFNKLEDQFKKLEALKITVDGEKENLAEQVIKLTRSIESSSQAKGEGEKNSVDNTDIEIGLSKKDEEISSLNNLAKEQEAQIRDLLIKQKSYEQKIKFMMAQITTNEKKMKNGSAQGSSDDPKLTNKIKQVEKLGEKYQAMADKAKAELIDKKAELHKSKQEARSLDTKVKDLERKLASAIRKNVA